MSTQSPSELKAQLLAQLAELEQLESNSIESNSNIIDSIPPSIISSPMTTSQLSEGQQIAFIHSRLEVVPGIITSINNNIDIYDLEVYIPTPATKIKFDKDKQGFKRITTTELIQQSRLKARLADPRSTFSKRMIALPQDKIIKADGIQQTHYDIFVPDERRKLDLPRFHDFHTSLVGTFFDPSIYLYQVVCFRGELEIDGQKFPPVREVYPKKKSHYELFHKAFDRYFNEWHLGRSRAGSKWDSVQIAVSLKP